MKILIKVLLVTLMLSRVLINGNGLNLSEELYLDSKIFSIGTDAEAVQTNEISSENIPTNDSPFKILPIDSELQTLMDGKSYKKNEIITYADLRCVKIMYYGFDELDHEGMLIVNKAIAEDILTIFKSLYEAKFPIESVRLIDEFDADDELSMAANNTSAFNYRPVSGSEKLSNHAYGLAIDINPLINPYVTEYGVYPDGGEAFTDRTQLYKGMIRKGDICYETFKAHGFTWGGDWHSVKDYQHFEITIEGIN